MRKSIWQQTYWPLIWIWWTCQVRLFVFFLLDALVLLWIFSYSTSDLKLEELPMFICAKIWSYDSFFFFLTFFFVDLYWMTWNTLIFSDTKIMPVLVSAKSNLLSLFSCENWSDAKCGKLSNPSEMTEQLKVSTRVLTSPFIISMLCFL